MLKLAIDNSIAATFVAVALGMTQPSCNQQPPKPRYAGNRRIGPT